VRFVLADSASELRTEVPQAQGLLVPVTQGFDAFLEWPTDPSEFCTNVTRNKEAAVPTGPRKYNAGASSFGDILARAFNGRYKKNEKMQWTRVWCTQNILQIRATMVINEFDKLMYENMEL
jgi:hypothetical protein